MIKYLIYTPGGLFVTDNSKVGTTEDVKKALSVVPPGSAVSEYVTAVKNIVPPLRLFSERIALIINGVPLYTYSGKFGKESFEIRTYRFDDSVGGNHAKEIS